MADDKNIRDRDRILIRVPDGLKEMLAERAALNDRSMNSEIVDILLEAVSHDDMTEAALMQEWSHLRVEAEHREMEALALKSRMAELEQRMKAHRQSLERERPE